MNKIAKLSLSLLLIICLIIPSVFINAETQPAAIPTGYTTASDVEYVKSGKYVANWGARGETATFLSSYAEDFYDGNTEYDVMSEKLGSSTLASVPTSDLYKSLQTTMKDKHSYIISYAATRDLYKFTDCVRSDYSQISSFYSGGMFGSAWDSGKTWNREHVWPNSKGDLAGNGENDIMMLRPTLTSENGSRGNKAYGTTTAYYNPNGESGGKYDLRGDVSRVILYQYVRWGCINTGSKYNSKDIFGTDGVIESLDVLLLWMEQDPVDTWEMGRNDAVQSITGTRNVFVDYPEYAWILFGEEIPEDIVTPSGEGSGRETSGTTGTCTWALDGTVLTISGNGKMDSYSDYDEAPWGTKITKVIIEDGVLNIGDYAFAGAENLAEVIMPNSLKYIGSYAFTWCGNLSKVTLPNNLTFIGTSAFEYCESLTSINIPKTVTNIGNYAFNNCFALFNIYYGGTAKDKESITIGTNNSVLASANWHYTACKHVYDNDCDTDCNTCGETRTVSHNYEWIIDKENNCGQTGLKHEECSVCGVKRNEDTAIEATGKHVYDNDCDNKCNICEEERNNSHVYIGKTVNATTSQNGKKYYECCVCGDTKSTLTIYKASKVYLSTTEYAYNGETKKPSVKVYDSKGKKLTEGEDYTLTRPSSSKNIGKYKITVTFKGDYAGTKNLYYTIGPKNTSSVKATLYGHDDVKVSWSKVSSASGYKVYYKTSSSDAWSSKTTTSTSTKLSNLSDGKKYNIKVVAYKTVSGVKCYNSGKETSIYTLKKITGVKVAKSSSSVKVSWSNISGETGYQISKSTSKSKTDVVSTYKTTSGKSKTLSAAKGKTYYYKVRAYKEVDGKKIYGPWSDPIKYVTK